MHVFGCSRFISRREDSDNYTCKAESQAGVDYQHLVLTVLGMLMLIIFCLTDLKKSRIREDT